ncbi:hypothetical protein TNIN_318601 [Trichonephila inaurata madagascariensis]|uniref:RNase H type-1 domain-containing protein n=1 Tax=Trichonephila inaurata madagascariensis TaxID=2747483 RepID=A0A8X6XVJ7_9ARAC|nr:hypothetical protein TNIN_318601 [Trichonephila inaurata madagascariensis]
MPKLCDSGAAFQAIFSIEAPLSVDILKFQLLIGDLLQCHIGIAMQCIPSNCGIDWNENADCLVKKGTKIFQTSHNTVPFYSSKIIIKKYYREHFWSKFNQKNNQKGWFSKLLHIPKWPRDRAVADFRHWPRLPVQASKHDRHCQETTL